MLNPTRKSRLRLSVLVLVVGLVQLCACVHDDMVNRLFQIEKDIGSLKEAYNSTQQNWQQTQAAIDVLRLQVAEFKQEEDRVSANLTRITQDTDSLESQSHFVQDVLRGMNESAAAISQSISMHSDSVVALNASLLSVQQVITNVTAMARTASFAQQTISTFCWEGRSMIDTSSNMSPLCKSMYQECWSGRLQITCPWPTSPKWSSTSVEIAITPAATAVDVFPDGTIAIVLFGSGSDHGVARWPSTNGAMATDKLRTQSNVYDLAFEADGSIVYVTRGSDNSLWRIPANGGTAVKLKTFSSCYGVAVAPNKDIIVADYDSNEVVRCPSGITTSSGTCANIASGLNRPAGVDVAPNGDVIVADKSSNQILRIPASGGSPNIMASSIQGVASPRDVAVADGGHIVYAQDNGAIMLCRVASSNLNTCAGIETVVDDTVFGSIYGIALAPNGDIIVPDFSGSRVHRFAFQHIA